MLKKDRTDSDHSEEGFMLLGVVVLVFLVLLALSVAAPKVARDLRRDKEVEAIHRANEYVRAIQLFYLKNGHYPGNMEQLEKSNNVRFLRQKYVDPMTGKADWRLIHQNEAKTTVKGFFGQPLAGLPGSSGGLGSAASMASPGQGGAATVSSPTTGLNLGGPTSSPGAGSTFGPSAAGPSSPAGQTPGSATSSSPSSSSSFGVSSQSATSFTGGGAPIVGVGTSRTGDSISIVNEQTTYQTWEFLYDPRIEQMKAKAALLGGAQNSGFGSSSGTGSFGSGTSTPGSTSPLGGPPTTSPTSPSANPQ